MTARRDAARAEDQGWLRVSATGPTPTCGVWEEREDGVGQTERQSASWVPQQTAPAVGPRAGTGARPPPCRLVCSSRRQARCCRASCTRPGCAGRDHRGPAPAPMEAWGVPAVGEPPPAEVRGRAAKAEQRRTAGPRRESGPGRGEGGGGEASGLRRSSRRTLPAGRARRSRGAPGLLARGAVALGHRRLTAPAAAPGDLPRVASRIRLIPATATGTATARSSPGAAPGHGGGIS